MEDGVGHMKIVFLNVSTSDFPENAKIGEGQMPLNLLYLASYARSKGHEVAVVDAEIEGLDFETTKDRVLAEDPDLLAVTVPTAMMYATDQITQLVRNESDIDIAVGGYHPSALPLQTLKDLDAVNFVIVGEGEETLSELADALDKKQSLRGIRGLVFRENGKIVQNPPRPRIKDLDSLPFPARDLVKTELYTLPPMKRTDTRNSTSLVTSRGCPYDCNYCSSKMVWERKLTFRSAENVVDEIEECIQKYNLRDFNIYDDLFTLVKRRVIEICYEIRRRKLDINWYCMGRVDTISGELLHHMDRAGCRQIHFGLESGNQTVLDSVRKQTTLDHARRAVSLVKKTRILATGSFMIGNPGETEETVNDTINFARELQLDYPSFYIATPYPGTDLYNYALEKGIINKDVTWKDFRVISKTRPLLLFGGLNREQLQKLKRKAYMSVYLNPNYLMRRATQIRSLSEVLQILKSGTLLFKV